MHYRRLIAPFFGLAGFALVPWTLFLTFSLPSHHETADWRIVWAGFDLAEALALISVAITAIRHSPWLEALAAIAGTLLCTDAWFDITLEWGGKHMISSIVEAAAVELCRLRYDLVPDNWTPQIVKGALEVDPLLLGTITGEIVEEVSGILAGMLGDVVTWSGVDVVPRKVPANWREARAAGHPAGLCPTAAGPRSGCDHPPGGSKHQQGRGDLRLSLHV